MSNNIVQFNEEIIKGQIKELVRGSVRASNIGNTEPSENSQGKGGDLRSKYYPTLTVVRKT